MTAKAKAQESVDITVEDKLRALYELQKVDSTIDKIRILRGELPLEVQDQEDEIAGLQTRIANLEEEIEVLEKSIGAKNNDIVESTALIKKYEDQQMNVRNNREFDSLSKEIEFQTLEIQLSDKKIKEFTTQMEDKKQAIENSTKELEERNSDLAHKKSELDEIIAETQKDEDDMTVKSGEIGNVVEERLLTAYHRIRTNARNGLAVVAVERDACGGCFNKIPPQRQLDICSRKKIIVCEYCGRILVDKDISPDEDTAAKN